MTDWWEGTRDEDLSAVDLAEKKWHIASKEYEHAMQNSINETFAICREFPDSSRPREVQAQLSRIYHRVLDAEEAKQDLWLEWVLLNNSDNLKDDYKAAIARQKEERNKKRADPTRSLIL